MAQFNVWGPNASNRLFELILCISPLIPKY